MVNFFDLPLSVRQQIYRYALVPERVFVRPLRFVKDGMDKSKPGMRENQPTLRLLRASRVIYAEATPIFFGENVFSIAQVDGLAIITHEHSRALDNLALIRKIELIFDVHEYSQMAHQLTPTRRLTAFQRIEERAGNDKPKTTLRQDLFRVPQSLYIARFENATIVAQYTS